MEVDASLPMSNVFALEQSRGSGVLEEFSKLDREARYNPARARK
jgi:hypothetical protein